MNEQEEFEFRHRLEQEQQNTLPSSSNNDTATGLGATLLKLPFHAMQAGEQMSQGSKFSDTPMAQDASQLGRFGKNVVDDLKGQAAIIPSVLKGAGRLFMAPFDAARSGAMQATGTPFSQTPLAGDLQDAKSVAAAVPNAIIQRGKDLGVGQLLTGHPIQAAQTYNREAFNRPVSTAIDTAAIVQPIGDAAAGVRDMAGGLADRAAGGLSQFAEDMATRARGVTKRFLKTPEDVAQARSDSRLALNQGIISPFANAETMLSRTDALQKDAGQRIGQFLKSQNTQLDWGSMLDDLDALKRKFPADPDVVNRINNAKDMIRSTAIRNGGQIPFEAANQIKSWIQSKVPWNSDTATADVARKTAGTVRSNLDSQLENTALNNMQARNFGQFLQDKKTYGATDRISDSLMNRYSSEQGNNLMGLRETGVGIGELAAGNPKAALTAMGLFKGASKYGSQIASVAADRLANVLRSNPESLGSYAPVLSQAAARGPQALAAASDALQQSDPRYREMLGRVITFQPPRVKPLFRRAG